MTTLRLVVGASALSLVSSCLDPTEIIVEIGTNVACDVVMANGVAITIGAAGDDDAGTATVTSLCNPNDGGIGSLVVIPSGNTGEGVGIRVVMGIDASVNTCLHGGPAACIVARRALRFNPHTPLTLPVELDEQCINVTCTPDSTCAAGACVDASVECDGGVCGPPPPPACVFTKPRLVAPSSTALTPRLAKTEAGYAVLFASSDTELSIEEVDASGSILHGPFPLAQILSTGSADALGSDGTNYLGVFDDGIDASVFTTTMAPDGATSTEAFVVNAPPVGPGAFWNGTLYVTLGNGTLNQVSFLGISPTGGVGLSNPITPAFATEAWLSTAGATYYPSFLVAGQCKLFSCTPQKLFTFACTPISVPQPTGCTAIRTAANATELFVAVQTATSLAWGYSTGGSSGGSNGADKSAFVPLAVGSGFRIVWRRNGAVMTDTFPTSSLAALDPSATLGSTGTGIDAVADPVYRSRQGSSVELPTFNEQGTFTQNGRYLATGVSRGYPTPSDVMVLDTSGAVLWTRTLPFATHPWLHLAVRPDGQRIVLPDEATGTGLVAIDSNGTTTTLVQEPASTPSYGPDGVHFVVVTKAGIELTLEDFSQRRVLVPTGEGLFFQPSMSWDGTEVTYVRCMDDTQHHCQVEVVQVDSGAIDVVTDAVPQRFSPYFTPDGSSLVFAEMPHKGGFFYPYTVELLNRATGVETPLLTTDFDGAYGHFPLISVGADRD